MSIEQTLLSIDASLKTLVTIAQTLGAGDVKAAADTATKPAADSKPKADAKPKAEPAKPAAPEGPTFKQVTESFTALSKLEGGREKIRAIIDAFKKGAKVPELEALGKNAEIIAAIEAAMKPAETDSSDDLGI